jgi:hypothetical protein
MSRCIYFDILRYILGENVNPPKKFVVEEVGRKAELKDLRASIKTVKVTA